MKTIRQIADEIGVSKTAVNKQIANLGLRSGLRKNGNQFAIDEHQEALIKEAFSEKSQTEIENQTQTKTQTENHEVSDLVCVLQATIDTLPLQCLEGTFCFCFSAVVIPHLCFYLIFGTGLQCFSFITNPC